MPDSKKVVSTKIDHRYTVAQLEDMQVAGPPIPYDPAIVAAVSRAIAEIEIDLFRSKLTPQQSKLVSKARHFRGILWRIIPEGF